MIKLTLSTPVPEVATAFERHFSDDENVEIINKPFEAIPNFDCMVSAANSFGLMDGGVDAAITAFFGTQLMDRVQQHIISEYLGEQPVGTAFVIESGDHRHPWLVHSPTMRVPLIIDGTDAVYNATWAALLAIYHHNQARPEHQRIRRAVFPAMGAGCGQVPADSVARQMKLAWRNFTQRINEINWNYASNRQTEVFNTTAYCPSVTICPHSETKYIGCGEYMTYCNKSAGVCVSPRHQSDDVLTKSSLHTGAHTHHLNISTDN